MGTINRDEAALERLHHFNEPILRIIQEKYREMNKELHMVFVDLENEYDRIDMEVYPFM